MKPEEHLMQHYRYWTIPDLGLSEDEKGYVDALRIGAEAIKEVERLRAENEQLQQDTLILNGDKASAIRQSQELQRRYDITQQCIAEMEAERTVMLDQLARQQERIAELEQSQIWWMTVDAYPSFSQGTESGCDLLELLTAEDCKGFIKRIAELEAERQANALTIDARDIRFAELRDLCGIPDSTGE